MEKISGIWYNVRAYMDIFFSILTSDKVSRRFIASNPRESGESAILATISTNWEPEEMTARKTAVLQSD